MEPVLIHGGLLRLKKAWLEGKQGCTDKGAQCIFKAVELLCVILQCDTQHKVFTRTHTTYNTV